jgi:hypothetical protein
MKKIFWGLLLLAFIFTFENGFAFENNKKSNFMWIKKSFPNSSNTHINNVEGFEANTSKDFPNCIKLGSLPTQRIRQGRATQEVNGIVRSENYGIFDCYLFNKNLDIDVWLGISEIAENGKKQTRIFFKNDDTKSYRYYFQESSGWIFVTTDVNIRSDNEPDSKFFYRKVSAIELLEAEDLLKYFKSIDFSSKSAKIYKIINNKLLPND